MRSSVPRLSVLLAVVVLAAACTGGGSDGDGGVSEEGPRNPAVPVQHLVDPPSYPSPVTGDPELVELRTPEGDDRHQAYLAELRADGSLDGELVRGSLVLVTEGTTLAVPDGASTAALADGVVESVSDCPAPCEVSGPSLVAPPGWLPGIGVAAGWELLVPAPAN